MPPRSNDNILDIIDIIQGDTNLANMASREAFPGLRRLAISLNPSAPVFRTTMQQTTFWANFIARRTPLGQQAMQVVGSGDQAAIGKFVGQLQAFQKYVTNFDAAQGGIFEARFDNELLATPARSALRCPRMIQGLQTGNAALWRRRPTRCTPIPPMPAATTFRSMVVPKPRWSDVADVLSTAGTPAAAVAAAPAARLPLPLRLPFATAPPLKSQAADASTRGPIRRTGHPRPAARRMRSFSPSHVGLMMAASSGWPRHWCRRPAYRAHAVLASAGCDSEAPGAVATGVVVAAGAVAAGAARPQPPACRRWRGRPPPSDHRGYRHHH